MIEKNVWVVLYCCYFVLFRNTKISLFHPFPSDVLLFRYLREWGVHFGTLLLYRIDQVKVDQEGESETSNLQEF